MSSGELIRQPRRVDDFRAQYLDPEAYTDPGVEHGLRNRVQRPAVTMRMSGEWLMLNYILLLK